MRQLPPARGLQGFFRSTSCNMCLSRVRSATNPFNRRFSSSRCLSRLSSLTPIPCIPLLPTIQSSFADPELPAHFQPFGPSFDLFKRVDNPLLAVSFPWHFLSFLREPPTIRKLKLLPSSFRIQGQHEVPEEKRSPPETRRPPARRRVRELVHDGEALNRLRIIARERVADPRPDIVAHHRVTFVAQLS